MRNKTELTHFLVSLRHVTCQRNFGISYIYCIVGGSVILNYFREKVNKEILPYFKAQRIRVLAALRKITTHLVHTLSSK